MAVNFGIKKKKIQEAIPGQKKPKKPPSTTDPAVRPGANGPVGGATALTLQRTPRNPFERFTLTTEAAQRSVAQQETERRKTEAEQLIAGQREQLIARQQEEFNPLRQQFQQGLGQQLALAEQGHQARAAMRAGRAGLAFGGQAAAGAQEVAAAGQIAAAQSLGQFEQSLLLAQQQERAAFDRGEADFTRNIFKMALQKDFQAELLAFQAKLAKDLQSQDLLGQIFEIGGGLGGTLLAAYLFPPAAPLVLAGSNIA